MSQVLARFNSEGFVSEIRRELDVNQREYVWFISDLDVDADGANGQNGKIAAYRADNKGSEHLANGGMAVRNGKVIGVHKWYADIVLVDKAGNPLVLPNGVIPSKTAYRFPGQKASDPAAYLDSETVPYVVVPPIVRTGTKGVVMGCLAFVEYRDKRVKAMVGDIGPRHKNGEGSIELCRRLGIPHSPRTGGLSRPDVTFHIYPGEQAEIDGVTYPLIPA